MMRLRTRRDNSGGDSLVAPAVRAGDRRARPQQANNLYKNEYSARKIVVCHTILFLGSLLNRLSGNRGRSAQIGSKMHKRRARLLPITADS